MAIIPFLAMTAGEIQASAQLPKKIGWMACHFSPYGTGLTNLPADLPEGALLILNDRIPIQGHDPGRILRQLEEALERLGCYGLLLDFQRPDRKETAQLTETLSAELPCPVAVSAEYAPYSAGPVLLPPLPHHVSPAEYIQPWKERDIWLEIAADGQMITVTEAGAIAKPLSPFDIPESGHKEESLHCHYQTQIKEDSVEFTLWRTTEDVLALLAQAEGLGLSTAVGLYQEFRDAIP